MLAFWILVGLAALLIGTWVLAGLIGRALPTDHLARVAVRIDGPPAEVFRTLADRPGQASWAPDIRRIEKLGEVGGHEVWREEIGRSAVVSETVEEQPPLRLVRTLAEESGPYTGRWELDVAPDGDGSRVTLTEHGSVRGGVNRFFARKVGRPDASARRYLGALARRYGQEPQFLAPPSGVPR